VRFGVTLPNVGVGDDPMTVVDMAVEAEAAGWEAVFVWDAPYVSSDDPKVGVTHEAWALLAAMAVRTERVLLGTMITPLAWRRPYLVARQAVTIDRLSGGRFVLPIGLGWVEETGHPFVEEADRRTRAVVLDESLEFLAQAWSGEEFSMEGRYVKARNVTFEPRPSTRIPVWVVGAWHTDEAAWPKRKSVRRALRWDGVLPNIFRPDGVTYEARPDELRQMVDWIHSQRTEPFDVVWEGGPRGSDRNATPATVRKWRDAGATWWLEAVWGSMYRHPGDPEPMVQRIRRGPPKL
jgi:hypothetical protein